MGRQLDIVDALMDRRVKTSAGRTGFVRRAMPLAGGNVECSLEHDDGSWSVAFARPIPGAPQIPFVVDEAGRAADVGDG